VWITLSLPVVGRVDSLHQPDLVVLVVGVLAVSALERD